jgi:hypothetical protein
MVDEVDKACDPVRREGADEPRRGPLRCADSTPVSSMSVRIGAIFRRRGNISSSMRGGGGGGTGF